MPHNAKIKCNRKMNKRDITHIVAELERWESGDLGSILTWKKIEDFSGYTRAALGAKKEIKKAYDKAKKALSKSGKPRIARDQCYIGYLEKQLKATTEKLNVYKEREKQWLKRWQRIAYHIQAKGQNSIETFDEPIPARKKEPDKKVVNNVLKLVDKKLPKKDRK